MEVGQLLEGGDEDGAGPIHHRKHLLESLFPTVVRVRHLATRFDGVEVTEEPDPVRVGDADRFDATYVGEVGWRPSRGPGRCSSSHAAENCWARCADGS